MHHNALDLGKVVEPKDTKDLKAETHPYTTIYPNPLAVPSLSPPEGSNSTGPRPPSLSSSSTQTFSTAATWTNALRSIHSAAPSPNDLFESYSPAASPSPLAPSPAGSPLPAASPSAPSPASVLSTASTPEASPVPPGNGEAQPHLIKNVDLKIEDYPDVDLDHPANPNKEFSIGDLHANAMGFLHFLIRQNILVLNQGKTDYEILKKIYIKQANDLKDADFKLFKIILDKAKINPIKLIRLIGDELCDRGMNDYFILQIFEKIVTSGTKIETLLSNHGGDFIIAYEKYKTGIDKSFCQYMNAAGQFSQSMRNLKKTLDNKVIEENKLIQIVENYYKPCVKLLSYTLHKEENKISIYSHAGIGLNTIESLAIKFKVPFNEKTIEELADTIDKINLKFKEHINNDTFHTLVDKTSIKERIHQTTNPIEFIMWNRQYNKIQRSEQHPKYGYHIDFIHGHDSTEQSRKNVINLDTVRGKALLFDNKGNASHLPGPYLVHQADNKGENKFQLPVSTSIMNDGPSSASTDSTFSGQHTATTTSVTTQSIFTQSPTSSKKRKPMDTQENNLPNLSN